MAAVRVRITDSSVLKLIQMWLTAVVIDEDEEGRPRGQRPRSGTPQGGVISPLLANIFLHWFDRTFLLSGPGQWANARLVRYADDFVVLARFVGPRIIDWVKHFIETRMGLTINRDKTRVINLKEQKASLDFLGFTFRFDRDLFGRSKRYLNVVPSKKALTKERENLRSMTTPSSCFVAIPNLVRSINRQIEGWANYFSFGYPRVAFRKMNRFVRERLKRHLKRRSQRPFRPPKGVSFHSHLKKLGLVYL
jgi:RNA-directed DNA polymerase